MSFIELLKVVLLGIVEGVTEWLPISSTGHMILLDEFIKLNITDEFKEMFFVVIQLGAILAVVVLFWNKLWPFSAKKGAFIKWDTMQMWFKVVVACLPGIVAGVLLEDIIDAALQSYMVVAITLIVYGVIFIIIENRNKNKSFAINSIDALSYKTALFIGLFQVLALIPGTSRSGATILGAMLLGTSRYVAAEFSFFLAVPMMFGASFYKLLKFGFDFTVSEIMYLSIGTVIAFVVSIAAIKFLVGYLKKNDFKAFGWYRIVLGILVLGYFLITK